jgi:hypothetical protein
VLLGPIASSSADWRGEAIIIIIRAIGQRVVLQPLRGSYVRPAAAGGRTAIPMILCCCCIPRSHMCTEGRASSLSLSSPRSSSCGNCPKLKQWLIKLACAAESPSAPASPPVARPPAKWACSPRPRTAAAQSTPLDAAIYQYDTARATNEK